MWSSPAFRFLRAGVSSLKELRSLNFMSASPLSTDQSMDADDVQLAKHYRLNDRFKHIGDKNVWSFILGLAQKYGKVNLGQGFPDYQTVPYFDEKIQDTLKESNTAIHQYTRAAGNLRLVTALAKIYGRFIGREIDPGKEILIGTGAYGCLHDVFSSLLNKDDEVIIIEPFFDCYPPMSVMNGAKCVYVPLRATKAAEPGKPTSSADWSWDDQELENAFTSKTKLIVINTPNNPLGKVYTRQELEKVADLCKKHNVLCISDEVYEHLSYDRPFVRIASLPGMWKRTLTVGCAGKAFSNTGLKIGWIIAQENLVKLCRIAHENNAYHSPTFFQEVVARCFEHEIERIDRPDCYFNSISNELRPKRDYLAKLLMEAGLTPVIPEGGYFMMADISKHAKGLETDQEDTKDRKFVLQLIKEKGLVTIPSTAFYSDENKRLGENYIRFCFFKKNETLEKAAEVLKNL